MLIPQLFGGLGNNMFQLASIASLAKQTGHSFGINTIPIPPAEHSTIDYSQSILKPWTQFYLKEDIPYYLIDEETITIHKDLFTNTSVNYLCCGYFQKTEYIHPHREEIIKLFDIQKVTDKEDAYFLHVRRGDYVNNPRHELNLETYYKNAVQRINTGVAHIVSNDVPWCESWSFLNDIRHTIVKENEVDSLGIMASCGKGGIAANSSFSWWGLYLDISRPHLILPNRWHPHTDEHDAARYRFPGSTGLDI
jgi:hypothetical protein